MAGLTQMHAAVHGAGRPQPHQGRAMTAGQPDSPAAEGVRSLEVRGMPPGQLEGAVTDWFGRFPAAMESRQDAYPLDPPSAALR